MPINRIYISNSNIPCALYSFPFKNAGTSTIPITVSITGISSTKEELYPKSILALGIGNGFIEIAVPLTSIKLNKLAPIIFPSDNRPCPLISD